MKLLGFPFKVLKHIQLEISAWFKLFIRAWPDGPVGHELRWMYWSKSAKLKGKGNIARMADIIQPTLAAIGSNFVCSEYAVVNPSDSLGIYIGDNVMLGPRVYIRAANHNFSNLTKPINDQGHQYATLNYLDKNYSVVIEDDVWIGANSIILSGAKIGKGAIIGAGSVVTREIPANCIAAGIPARVIRMREDGI
jgi:acetyltransferase-like isoleucine patch superfamily enzyme